MWCQPSPMFIIKAVSRKDSSKIISEHLVSGYMYMKIAIYLFTAI